MSHSFQACLALDNGTETRAYSVFSGSNPQPGTFAGDGPTRMSAIYLPSKQNDKPVFGRKAFTRGAAEPDHIFTHAKRGMYCEDPSQPWNGGPPAYQLYAMGLEDTFHEACRVFPHIPELIKNQRDQFSLAVTIPASWGPEQIAWVDRGVAEFTDIDRVDAFVPEPVGVVYHAGDHFRSQIKDGEKIAILDLGGGTFDISILQFSAGVWDELVGNAGSPTLGGNNYTCSLAAHIARKLGYKATDCFDKNRGLNLNHPSVPPRHRRLMYLIYNAAEEAKIALSAQEETVATIDIKGQVKEVPLTQELFGQLVESENRQAEDAIRSALEGSSLDWTKVEHVMLAGGSAGLVGMRQIAARATDRAQEKVLVSGDTTHAIASGAARRGFFAEETSMCVAGGISIKLDNVDESHAAILDPETGQPQQSLKWLIGTGDPVPVGGQTLERTGQFVRTSASGETALETVYFVAKPGVQKQAGQWGPLSEGIPLRSHRTNVTFPSAGDHDALIAIHMEPSGRMHATMSFPAHKQIEPILIPLSGTAGEQPESAPKSTQDDVLILMDCSGSMKDSGKMRHAKKAIEDFIQSHAEPSLRFGLIQFGDECRLVAPLGTSAENIVDAARQMQARGGTPLDDAILLACEHLKEQPTQGKTFVIVVCDGYPSSVHRSLEAASQLKKHAELFSVGIGPEVGESFLRQLASCPDDYQHGEAPELVVMFKEIAALCFQTQTVD